ncbi:hypothetical protein F5Y10DRAFT_200602 [Nemania abortiva]|nr:hypothetical protein F5Y10DRAFT_200602 [Nemania abortiva]
MAEYQADNIEQIIQRASQETTQNYRKEIMARTMQRLANDAATQLQSKIRAEFEEILNMCPEHLHIRASKERQLANAPERSLQNNKHCVSELIRNNMDIFKEYSSKTGNAQDNRFSIFSGTGAQKGINTTNDAINAASDIANEAINVEQYYDSDTKKSWLLDNNDEDEAPTFIQRGNPSPLKHGVQLGPNSGSSGSLRVPRNSARRSSQRIAIDSDDELPPRMSKYADLAVGLYRQRSPIRPVTREHLHTPGSVRRSSRNYTPVPTYSVKKAFKSILPNLEGPDFALPSK